MGRAPIRVGVRERFESGEEGKSICMICEKVVPGSHLGNLSKHLKRHHPDEYEKTKNIEPPIEPPRKKKKITVEYDEQELLDAWLELVIKEGRPFKILDSKALRKIIKPIFDAMGIVMLTSATVAEAIKEKAEERRREIQKLLCGRIFSLKIDSATRHRRRVVCINAQLIVNGKIVVKTLSMTELGRAHSGENIKEYVLSVLQRYELSLDQVYSVTQDNGRNFVCAANMMDYLNLNLDEPVEQNGEGEHNEEDGSEEDDTEDWLTDADGVNSDDDGCEEEGDEEDETEEDESDDDFSLDGLTAVQVILCAAHTLNLAVQDALKETKLKKVIEKFRKLAILLRTPTMRELLKSRKLTQPKKDVETRWNSAYDMVVSLKRLKPFCEKEKIKLLNDSDWNMGDIFLETYKPSKIASKLLQKEQLPLGDFFKVWLDLTLKVQKLSNQPRTKIFAANLHKHLLTREADMFKNNPTLLAALYLDPRFRRIMEKIKPTYFNVNEAQAHLLALYKQLKKVKNDQKKKIMPSVDSTAPTAPDTLDTPSTSTAKQTVPSTSAGPSVMSSTKTAVEDEDSEVLLEFINSLYDDQSDGDEEQVDRDDDIAAAFAIICKYDDKQPLETNLLDYWHKKRFSNPILYELASIIHAVPATQVTVERCFSVLKYILSDYRTCLRSDTLENLMILRLNFKW